MECAGSCFFDILQAVDMATLKLRAKVLVH